MEIILGRNRNYLLARVVFCTLAQAAQRLKGKKLMTMDECNSLIIKYDLNM